MNTPSRFTKIKVVSGYVLLLSVLLLSLVFVYREIEYVTLSGREQHNKTDSILYLLRQKDENMIQMLRTLNDANEQLLNSDNLDLLISGQDSVFMRQRVQHRVVTRRDSLITPAPKKGFFKRLADAFSPSRDTAVLINTSLELSTDTLLDNYNHLDSLHQRLLAASRQRRDQQEEMRRQNYRLRRINRVLTVQIDSLINSYERELILEESQKAEEKEHLRTHSIQVIGSVAIGAVILAGLFLLFIWRDITRSNRYRNELEIARKKAEDLLEAREKLMLTITHDFKAPLSSIIGYLDLLSQESDDTQYSYLSNMKSSSEHLLKLVNDLLDFHRLDLNKMEINREFFYPYRLMEDIRISFEPLIEKKGLNLSYSVSPELSGRFIGDPLRIRQVIENLLSNAVKFTGTGTISFKAEYVSSRLIVSVSDTGKGMSAEEQETIFKEFTRLPGAQGEEGFGLGLSIVRKIVDLLQGNIRLESAPGAGSCFTIDIPLYPVAHVDGDNKEVDEPAPEPARKLRILVIDDDRIQLELTAAMLKHIGADVMCCQTADEIIGQLRVERFDLLLSDIQMPAMNGFDLLRLLRTSSIKNANDVPVVAVSARSDMEEKHFKESGFAGWVGKPFTAADLIRVLNDLSLVPDTAKTNDGSTKPIQKYNLDALLMFSDDDPVAKRQILETFVSQTEEILSLLSLYTSDKDTKGIAGIAHKLLPLVMLLEMEETALLLKELEKSGDQLYDTGMGIKSQKTIKHLNELIAAVKTVIA